MWIAADMSSWINTPGVSPPLGIWCFSVWLRSPFLSPLEEERARAGIPGGWVVWEVVDQLLG